jgi:hypothetical protein
VLGAEGMSVLVRKGCLGLTWPLVEFDLFIFFRSL